MHFWPKLATQEAPNHPMNDPLPTQKNGQKNFFGPEMVKFGLVEISAPPKSTFLGWGGRNFFGPHQRGSKALVKSFWCRPNHFGALETSQSRKLLKLGPKMRFCRNFCTPKIDLFGAGWSKFFRPAPNRSQSPQKTCLVIPNPFLGYGGFLEPKIADFRPKNRNFWRPIWPKFLHVGVRPAPKIFSELQSC